MRGESLEQATTGRSPGTFARLALAVLGLIAAAFSTAALADNSPVYRFYNTRTGTHFYTISQSERDTVLNNYPQYAYEGAVYTRTAQNGSPCRRDYSR